MRPREVDRWVLGTSGVFFLLLVVLVANGLTQPFDDWVREVFRPDDVWEQSQARVDVIVEGLRPTIAFAVLVCAVGLAALKSRSWRPAVLGAGVVVSSVVLTDLVQHALGRPDPHGAVIGGSFPSGHTLASTVIAGVVALLATGRRRTRLLYLVAIATGCLMSWALLVQAAHWATDVIGGLLLGVAILAGAHCWWVSARSDVHAPSEKGPGGSDRPSHRDSSVQNNTGPA